MTTSRRFHILILAALCAACSRSSDEEQIRASIDASETAFEARDASGVLKWVADDYRDNLGNDKDRLRGFLRGYFITHPKIELLVHVKDLKIETARNARAEVEVAMVGTKSTDAQTSLTADSQLFQVDFQRIDSNWRVVRVDRKEAD